MQYLVSFLAIVVVPGVMAFGATEYEDRKAFMGRSMQTGCGKPTDVIFLLDASSSIYGPDFRKHLDFVRTIIRDLHIDPSMVRCGLITYGDQVRVEFGLQTYSSAETAMKAVSLVRQLRGGTRTELALQRMRQIMAEDKRPGVPQIGIVITDGQSDYTAATRQEAEMAHKEGIALFAVGVGPDVDYRELRAIASLEEFLFLLTSQKELEVLKGQLSRTICSYSEEQQDEEEDDVEPLPECKGVPLDLTFLLDHSIAFFPENLQVSQRFVKDCLSLLYVSKDETQVSVITFGDVARLQFDFDAYSNVTDIRFGLSRVGMRHSKTDIASALSILGSPQKKYRKEATKVAVIVTGGLAGDPLSVALEATRLKEESGVVVFVVGVGAGVDLRELESIASYLSHQSIFLVDSYEGLDSITLKLINTVCGVTPGITRHTKQPPATKPVFASSNMFTVTVTTVPILSTATTTQPSTDTKTSERDLATSAVSTGSPSTETRETTPVAPSTESSRVPSRAPLTRKTPRIQSTTQTSTSRNISKKWTSPASVQPRTLPNRYCSRMKPADIVFVLPCSLGAADAGHALEFIALLDDQLGGDGEAVRMGVTPRLCPLHVRGITLDEGSRNDHLRKALDDRRLTANHSDIVSLLRYVSEVSFSEEQMVGRGDTVKIAVVFFDPKDGVNEEVIQEVKELKRNRVVVVGVSVGEGDDASSGLKELTSCQNCLLQVKSYSDLDDQLPDTLATIVMDERCVREVDMY